MEPRDTRIGVVPIGEVPALPVKAVAAHIEGYLNLAVDVLPALPTPIGAYDPGRLQYDAALVLKILEETTLRSFDKVIGIVSVDLFIPIFTYVYGEAAQGGRCAVASLYRLTRNLDGSLVPQHLLLERAGKVSLHELCHLYDLPHCMDERCLMHFSGDLTTLDKTPPYLCRYCSLFLREALEKAQFVTRPDRPP
jgi:archaemetzincin